MRPSYKQAHDKIVEDYAKSKEKAEHHDPGAAEDYNTAAGFHAVEESRQALMGLQDKQTELLEAQNDLQGQAVTHLQHISDKLGNGTSITNVDSIY